MQRQQLPIPRTLIIHRDNTRRVERELGLPCILKQPDSAFSQGVIKVDDAAELRDALRALLARSDLVIGQSFLPTDFDWRIGILDGRPLYACRYYMARRHWQIIKRSASGRVIEGRYETLGVDEAPQRAVRLALKAAAAVGTGLYGVDIKETGGRFYVIEVNDNPSIDSGVEDKVLGDALYEMIMSVFATRIEAIRARR